MDDVKVRLRWRARAEKEMGGPDMRVEAAILAAMTTVNQRQTGGRDL